MPLYLIARIGDEAVALAAETVRAVIRPVPLTPIPRAPAHIVGLCALRSRVLTVVSARAAIGRGRIHAAASMAIIVESGGHDYAILLDGVDDVVEAPAPAPCPAALDPGWRAVSTGLVTHDGGMMLLIDPAALIEGRGSGPDELTDR